MFCIYLGCCNIPATYIIYLSWMHKGVFWSHLVWCRFSDCSSNPYNQNEEDLIFVIYMIYLGKKMKRDLEMSPDKIFTVYTYRISANSFRGNYSFLDLALCTVTFDHYTYRCGNYSREETIQGWKLHCKCFVC